MYIFIDESGDLGFDFTKKGTSKFFIVSALISEDIYALKAINLATHKALKKINNGKRKDFNNELKGTETPLVIKKYFFNRISDDNWNLYSVIVNKQNFRTPKYIKHTNHLYNYVTAYLLNAIAVNKPESKIIISIDKCKMAQEIYEFNREIEAVFYSKLNNINNLTIKHKPSNDDKLLQAIDLFCNGLFAKYEHNDTSWYSYFQGKIYKEDNL